MSPYMIKRIVGTVTVVATIVLVCMITLVIGQCVQINNLNRQSKLLDSNISKIMVTKTDLQNGIDYRNSEEYLEKQARENLGMIKDGETIYVFE